jgi:hypothetical protein
MTDQVPKVKLKGTLSNLIKYFSALPCSEIEIFIYGVRISQLQLLDELEEWRLLAAHYCVAWAWKCNIDNAGLANIRLS